MQSNHDPLRIHQETRGKIATSLKMPLNNKRDLAIAYTPGVAEPCQKIAQHLDDVYTYTHKGNTVAVVSDGSAVLGLGNIGPEAALPVMEGKCALFKQFADIDAWPIVLDTQNTEEIIATVRAIAPGFGGINLEDISAPRCFEIEEALQDLGIPVFHDDQHGTAIVVLAGVLNAAKVVGKNVADLSIVIAGAGAAGVAITKLFLSLPVNQRPADIVLCDSKGIIHADRDDLNTTKQSLLSETNQKQKTGTLADALLGADVFIGVSAPNSVTIDMVQSMAERAIIFALSNPRPEIMPNDARNAGAAVVATGRSDFPNQVNNVLAFPGIFRGVLDQRLPAITINMKLNAALALASLVPEPSPEMILPDPFDDRIVEAVAAAVR